MVLLSAFETDLLSTFGTLHFSNIKTLGGDVAVAARSDTKPNQRIVLKSFLLQEAVKLFHH